MAAAAAVVAAGRSRARKSRIVWTEKMTQDLLTCRDKALCQTNSINPPRLASGRKKGYMTIMKDLWDDMGYKSLGLSAQNLRDHAAAKAEKSQEAASDDSIRTRKGPGAATSLLSQVESEVESSSNVNREEDLDLHRQQDPDLHISFDSRMNTTPIPSQRYPQGQASIHMDQDQTTAIVTGQSNQPAISDDNNAFAMPGKLPNYKQMDAPSTVFWGQDPEGKPITVSLSTIENAYNEIVKWRKNTFLVPYGKIGREFIDKFTEHINQWNNRSPTQHLALKSAIILLAVGLQKPYRQSKAKDHQECLVKRLERWNRGEIDSLVREGRAIQKRLTSSKRKNEPDYARVFANLVMAGQINSALRYLSDENEGGVLPLTEDVMSQLQDKHPEAQEAQIGTLVFGPKEEVTDSIYQQINGEMVREAALRTKGSGGPSGVDANGFRRMMACKSFKKSGSNLCSAIATMTKRLCTEYIDPCSIEALLANRLIPLDKGKGAVRPIGVGEVIRRIMGKCVSKVTKEDVIEASGPLQACAGHKSGSEAAVHAMRNVFSADETDAVLLIDASNAFNSLNRATALHNISVLCPSLAVYAINTYRKPARLFVIGGKELASAEGTTQGDPLAMSLYAISVQPLITRLQNSSSVQQCWFADDATGSGTLKNVKQWWDELSTCGPAMGYFPNARKCWLITKPNKEEEAKVIFRDTAINITTEGHKHLGAALGSRSYFEEYVGGKVDEWVRQVTKLAEFAISQPQASYAAFTFGLRHRWTYFLRTLPDIAELLEPLESAISNVLIPSMTEHQVSNAERDLLALPVRIGGLGMVNPVNQSQQEYEASMCATGPLVQQIMRQAAEPPCEESVADAQRCAREVKSVHARHDLDRVIEALPLKTQRAVDFARDKGASSWLTVLPLKEMNYSLNKREFRDAIKLRYGWDFSDIPTECICGERFDVDHAMICKHGGFTIQRHNELRDLEAEMLRVVCNDVEVEPTLQEVTGEVLLGGSNRAPDARLDIRARGFWAREQSAFFDVRVCHPNADSYRNLTSKQIFRRHNNEKKRQYSARVLEIEQGTFTPLVFTTTGGMSEECLRYHSRLAELLASKKQESYASTVSWIRTKVSFAMLRSAITCLRGSRTRKRRTPNMQDTDIEVEVSTTRSSLS